jgi:alpha-1,3-rhamnosyl/mannosyltransferase
MRWTGRTVLAMFDALQEVLPEAFSPLVRWQFGARYRLAASRANRILVPSRATALDIERIYGVESSRIAVIPPAVDAVFRPRPPRLAESLSIRNAIGVGRHPYFLFVGKRSKRRNIPAVIEAFQMVRLTHPNHVLLFVGPLGADADALKSHAGVVVAGHAGDTTLAALLADAEGLLYPSEYEGFGLPVLEALASGCPVLTLRNSALPEAGGEGAWYLDRADPRLMAEVMTRMIDDREARARRIELGLAHAALFTPTRFAAAVNRELLAAAAGAFDKSGNSLSRRGQRHAARRPVNDRAGI